MIGPKIERAILLVESRAFNNVPLAYAPAWKNGSTNKRRLLYLPTHSQKNFQKKNIKNSSLEILRKSWLETSLHKTCDIIINDSSLTSHCLDQFSFKRFESRSWKVANQIAFVSVLIGSLQFSTYWQISLKWKDVLSLSNHFRIQILFFF